MLIDSCSFIKLNISGVCILWVVKHLVHIKTCTEIKFAIITKNVILVTITNKGVCIYNKQICYVREFSDSGTIFND